MPIQVFERRHIRNRRFLRPTPMQRQPTATGSSDNVEPPDTQRRYPLRDRQQRIL